MLLAVLMFLGILDARVIMQVIVIDCKAREIMYLVASVRLSVRPSVCPTSHGRTECSKEVFLFSQTLNLLNCPL